MAPTLLTVAEVRQHVTTGLPDPAMQRLLDASADAITEWTWDPAGPVEELASGGGSKLVLDHPVGTITGIDELASDGTPTPVPPDQYLADGYLVTRLGGTWASSCLVTYTPRDNTPMRELTQVNLVKAAIAYEGVTGQSLGDWSGTWGAAPFATVWREHLANLREPQMLVI